MNNAELDAIKKEAQSDAPGAIATAGAAGSAQLTMPAAPDIDREKWIATVRKGLERARGWMPALVADEWTPARLDDVAGKVADCAKLYGWTLSDLFTHPVLGLCAASAPLLWPMVAPFLMPRIEALLKKLLGEGVALSGVVVEHADGTAQVTGADGATTSRKIAPLDS